MANSFKYKEDQFRIGDTVKVTYKIQEGNKERAQAFSGILIKIRGNSVENRMITVRKLSKSGIGIERILPLQSPYITDIQPVKRTSYARAKLYFIRDLSEQKLRQKIYRSRK